MKSFPHIESSLSEVEQEFIGFVESHAAALYQADSDRGLPGDTVRMRMSSTRDDAPVRRHTIEFMSLDAESHWQTGGCIGHALKEIDDGLQLESRFEVRGPGLADEQVTREEIESVVLAQLQNLRAARLLTNLSKDMVRAAART